MARFFFHLVDSKNVIRDDYGALAEDLADAHRAAMEVIEEFKLEQAQDAGRWQGWRLLVVDENADLALVLPLAPEPDPEGPLHS